MLSPIGSHVLHGYNPNEPRDWHGRWTTGGGGASARYRNARPMPAGRWRGLVDGQMLWPQTGHFLYGGQLFRIQNGPGRGIGDNQPPEGEPVPETEPFNPAPRVPQGWDTPGQTVGGLQHPPTRRPVFPDGTPWIVAGHDQVKALLALQHRVTPSMVIFVPADGMGPSIVGSTSTADFPLPSGYDTVTLIGTPQVVVSRRGETGHAADSIDEALRLAETNRFSDIYFNRSFSTATNRLVQSRIRPDVIAVAREPFSVPYRYHPYESFSKGQTAPKRQNDMPPFPFIAPVYGNQYSKKK